MDIEILDSPTPVSDVRTRVQRSAAPSLPSPETRPDPESESHSPASDGTTFPNDNSSRSAHSAAEESAARTIVALSYRSYADTMLEGALRTRGPDRTRASAAGDRAPPAPGYGPGAQSTEGPSSGPTNNSGRRPSWAHAGPAEASARPTRAGRHEDVWARDRAPRLPVPLPRYSPPRDSRIRVNELDRHPSYGAGASPVGRQHYGPPHEAARVYRLPERPPRQQPHAYWRDYQWRDHAARQQPERLAPYPYPYPAHVQPGRTHGRVEQHAYAYRQALADSARAALPAHSAQYRLHPGPAPAPVNGAPRPAPPKRKRTRKTPAPRKKKAKAPSPAPPPLPVIVVEDTSLEEEKLRETAA